MDPTRDFGWSASELIGDRLDVRLSSYACMIHPCWHEVIFGPREPPSRNYDQAVVDAIVGCGCEKRVVHLEDARASSSLRDLCSSDVQPVQ